MNEHPPIQSQDMEQEKQKGQHASSGMGTYFAPLLVCCLESSSLRPEHS